MWYDKAIKVLMKSQFVNELNQRDDEWVRVS